MTTNKQSKKIVSALKGLASSGKTEFSLNQLRVIIALERLVARLESNPILSKHLVFKGGFALLKHLNSARFTHDLDASYFLFPLDRLIPLIKDSISANLEDGLWYGDVRHESILIENDYDGIRFNCAFQIGESPNSEAKIKKLSRIHFDIGLSDEKFPQLEKMDMPSFIEDNRSVSWYVYPLEQIFAEKLETFVKRGAKNSRAKDLYDMVSIYPHCSNAVNLTKTIQQVFRDRNTDLPKSVKVFGENLDLEILRASWRSVIIPEPKPSFDDTWHKLLNILSALEEQF
ncbi:MAG: nucleotidyl transferase AbiEii/AbiGii toxin family protein [Myxococcales bacterium]|nr:nucleotidyl transferase AbiEii/AbiGii toxin family protein [Myxococcales bacterium]USN50821.1 MAG: nucleotidyl transferase AbiEii/AbiGii toxin family protein [Myxococcales bacterium]